MASIKLNSYEIFSQSGDTAPTLGTYFPSNEFIPLKGLIHSDGSTSGSGSAVDMLSLSLDLSNYEGYLLYGWCHTAISENSNTSNTIRVRLKLNNGSTNEYFASQRQGMSAYSISTYDTNSTTYIGCQGYYVITSSFATACTLYMNGGIDSGAFTWGDQGSYTNFDGETPNAGGTLGFILFRM